MKENSLKKRINKFIDYYESGELIIDTKLVIPTIIPQSSSDRDFKGGFYYLGEQGLQFEDKDNGISYFTIGYFCKYNKKIFEESGTYNCCICDSVSNKEYIVARLFSSKHYSFCYLCALILDEKYDKNEYMIKWRQDKTQLNLSSISENRELDYSGGWIKFGDLAGPILKDLKNFTLLKKDIIEQREQKLEFYEKVITRMEDEISKLQALHLKIKKSKSKKEKSLKNSIINLLKEKAVKMPASDIDAYLKYQDVDKIKEVCEEMYQDGEISYAGNGRYFILTEEQEKPKKTSAAKSEEVDVEKELEKYKGLLDKGLITQEEYDAKRKQILGL